MTGIRSEVCIDAPTDCTIAQISREMGTSSRSISRSVAPDASERVTEEFTADDEIATDDAELEDEVTRVFSYGDKDVYRFTRPLGRGCPCERVERFDCPIVDVYTQDGALYLSFHAPDIETLQAVIESLQEESPNLTVERLFRSRTETTEPDLIVLDRDALTDRQQEVLAAAHEMGYFDHPKEANAGEVADALGITTSTFTEHLAAAQRKLLDAILNDRTASLSSES